jgi:tRNA pseudouridine(38-40) synthase
MRNVENFGDRHENDFTSLWDVSPIRRFEHTLNEILPNDIRVFNLSVAPEDDDQQTSSLFERNERFHASISALAKTYEYQFTLNPLHDPKYRHFTTFFPYQHHFDTEIFRFCLDQFIGTHDFSAFADRLNPQGQEADDSIEISPIRTVYSIEMVSHTDESTGQCSGHYTIKFHLKSALYRMIRNMVGTCVQVATGVLPLRQFLKFITTPGLRRCDNKAKAAPPEGLCLQHVFYKNF